MNKIMIKDEFITLGQMLKLTNLFQSGGHIKIFLQNEGVYLNDEVENRRGKKLYNGDKIKLPSGEHFIIVQQ